MDNLKSMMKAHLVTLDGNNTMRALLPLLSLGKVTARYEPKTKHFSHCKNHRSSWPNKTQDSERLTRISNHAYKKSAKTQIYIIDNLITNPQFIGSRQTHRQIRLHRIDLHEDHGELCIEDPRERRSHLVTSYGPVGLWWTTHASSERSWCWWRSPPYPNPPPRQGTRTCPRWDLAETEACGGGKVLSMFSWFFLRF